jgi:multiple sugar transport system permease protein
MARKARRTLSYLVLIAIGIVGIAPFVYLLILSLKSRIEILDVPPTLHFDWATIKENYRTVISDQDFLVYIRNSVIVTGVSTILALGIGVPAAYAFSRLRFRGSERWATTILTFRFMPPVAVAIPIYLMINAIGRTDSFTGLILPYIAFSLPLVVWIMIGFFDEIPRELDEAALVDGCSRWSALLHVIAPLARPGMVVAGIFGVIFIWNEFLVGLYVITSQGKQTIPIAASGLLTAESPIDWNIAATVGVLTVVPILLFSIFVQRYIVRGITAGAIK